jgi:hypothetical protein
MSVERATLVERLIEKHYEGFDYGGELETVFDEMFEFFINGMEPADIASHTFMSLDMVNGFIEGMLEQPEYKSWNEPEPESEPEPGVPVEKPIAYY